MQAEPESDCLKLHYVAEIPYHRNLLKMTAMIRITRTVIMAIVITRFVAIL